MQHPQQSMRLELNQEQEQKLDTQQMPAVQRVEVQRGTRFYLVGWVRGHVRRALHARMQYTAGGTVSIPEDALEGVSARIARAVFYKLLKECDMLKQDDLPSAASLESTIGNYADSEVKIWYEMQKGAAPYDVWISERDYPTQKKYKEEHPHDRANAELLQSYFSALDVDTKRGRWADFDHVRSSRIVNIDASNIDEYLPKIEKAYHHDEFNVDEFVHHKKRGFIFPDFDEPFDGKPSIKRQMHENFIREPGKNDPLYKGKGLVDRHGELIAWGTYWQTPVRSSKKHQKMMQDLLSGGLTGGTMQYLDADESRSLHQEMNYLFHLDTVQSLAKMGMSRLFAHILQDALLFNSRLKALIGYRQLDLKIDPPIRLRNSTIRIAPNLKSRDFFHGLGCEDYAIDFNPNIQPAIRMLKNDHISLNPKWVHFRGDIIEIYLRAWQQWRSKQYGYGDITSDGYNRSILHADIAIPKLMSASATESETQHILER